VVKKIKVAAALLLIAGLVVFLLQNLNMVEVDFLAWSVELPLGLPIVIGFFIGGLAARPLLRFLNRQRRERATDRRSARVAEKAAREQAAADA
jgi:uncharacterized integral membrane protein